MKKAQVPSKLLMYILAIAVGVVIFYVIYLGVNALFSVGKIYAVKECKLVGEYDGAVDLVSQNPKSNEALQKFQKVVAECKGTEQEHASYVEIGKIYLFKDEYSAAVSSFNYVFEYEGVRDEKYSESAAKAQYYICGIYLYHLKDYDKALEECTKLSLYSYADLNFLYYYYLGEIYYKKGDFEKAKINYKEFVDSPYEPPLDYIEGYCDDCEHNANVALRNIPP
jgi:tetratricopeptide (TPR) repeat protein